MMRSVIVGLSISAIAAIAAVIVAAHGVTVATKAPPPSTQVDPARHGVPAADAPLESIAIDLKAIRQGAPAPRKFYRTLPPQLLETENVALRKSLFASTMLPLIARANEIIAAERARIRDLRDQLEAGFDLSTSDQAWLADMTARHGLDTPPAEASEFGPLLERVDIVPEPLALAQAAIESGWGRSRFAREGNAMFGEWTWTESDKGIVPTGRPEGRSYRVKAFDLLLESVLSYAETLNSGRAFKRFRELRAEARRADVPMNSAQLADTLDAYSARGRHYGAELRQIMVRGNFSNFAGLKLEPPYDLEPAFLGLALIRSPMLTAEEPARL